MMAVEALVSIFVLLWCSSGAKAFSTHATFSIIRRDQVQASLTVPGYAVRGASEHAPPSFKALKSSVSGSSKDAEIAELEEKLRKLKEEQEAGEISSFQEVDNQQAATTDIAGVLSDVKSDSLMPEMLSESWKVEDEGSSDFSPTPALLAVAAVAILTIFAQVPVGQDELKQYAGNIKETSSSIDLGDMNPVKSVKDIVYTAPEE